MFHSPEWSDRYFIAGPFLQENLGAGPYRANTKAHFEKEKDRNAGGLGLFKQVAAPRSDLLHRFRGQDLGLNNKGPVLRSKTLTSHPYGVLGAAVFRPEAGNALYAQQVLSFADI